MYKPHLSKLEEIAKTAKVCIKPLIKLYHKKTMQYVERDLFLYDVRRGVENRMVGLTCLPQMNRAVYALGLYADYRVRKRNKKRRK